MKKSIPKVRERESEASILGNDREREFPLTPVASPYGFVFVAQFFQTRGAMRMKAEEAEDLLSRVKPGQVTVGILS